jgi:hypothetical protein
MINSAGAETISAKTRRTDSDRDKQTMRTRRPRENSGEGNGNACTRYFLSKAGSNGGIPALDKEVNTEGDALVESLRQGVTFYAVQEFRVVPVDLGVNPATRRASSSCPEEVPFGRISIREKAALERLIRIAHAETGQGRMTAEFLLSWWNAQNFGGFDLTRLWDVDPEIVADMVTVFTLIAKCRRFPDDLGYDEELRRIVHTWRPMPEAVIHEDEEPSCAVLAS